MEIYISIDGVLRNFIQKFDYHYRDYFIELEEENNENQTFDYKIIHPIQNDNLLNYYTFQSKEEYENFCFIDYALEIFGHTPLSYPTVITELNKLIYNYKNINFTVVGLNELAKAKPSSLFFLSKNGFLGNNIKFIKTEDIVKEWKKCDLWITDNEEIINHCPDKKTAIKFNTQYNEHFSHNIEINKLNEIEKICLKFLEKNTSSILTKLLKSVVRIIK